MPTPHITCPHCHTPISLDDALTGQIQAVVEQKLSVQYEEKLLAERKAIEQKVKDQVAKETSTEVLFLKQQLEDKKKKLDDAAQRELDLRKKEVEFEEKERLRELEIQRQMDEERKKIRETTELQMLELQRQKDLENEKKLADMKKALDEAQRKANQGSQQTQGEVRELILEEILRATFPQDIIEPIGKGVHGADIRQIVRSTGGTVCGTILWESKQTKSWQEAWIGKLKEDVRSEKADLSALVTAAFNEPNWSGMTLKDGVWVCSFSLVIPMCMLLRKTLLDSGYQKAVAAHRGTKAELIYDYITGIEFRQQLEAVAEVFTEMNEQIQKERVVFEKQWKVRESQVRRLSIAAANMVGSIQGLAGQNALPGMDRLELASE